ncbi:MAG TPA: PEGA domain-containing protein [Methanoregula sp.]|nr:PEGA domain-containing protein [Methanoregula sp.]
MKKNMILKTVIFILLFCTFISGCISSQDSGKGTIQLSSSPSGAEVYLDNQYQGSTPGTITNVEQGNHTLEFRYPGYQSWSAGISVPSGTSHFFAALAPHLNNQPQPNLSPITTSTTKITIQASKNTMIVGDSIVISGTCVRCDNVLLTIFGPGKYSNGISLIQQNVNEGGSWSFTWNPGQSIQSGSYIFVATDPQKTTSGRVGFSVVGGGEVSITSNSFSIAKGDTLRLSGRCTTGAQNVLLVLYGPERYSSGVELGTLSVMGDKTWSFKYTFDTTTPTGVYTMYVYDIPKTTSGSTQFTVGYA